MDVVLLTIEKNLQGILQRTARATGHPTLEPIFWKGMRRNTLHSKKGFSVKRGEASSE